MRIGMDKIRICEDMENSIDQFASRPSVLLLLALL